MPVLSIKTFRAEPGRQDELLALLADARATMLRVDDRRTVRIFRANEDAPDAGTVSIMIEYASMDEFREIRAKEQADPGWQQIGERANGERRPAETLSYFQLTELTESLPTPTVAAARGFR
jgi:hypothetical protein